MVAEAEGVEQVVNGWTVQGDVGIAGRRHRIGVVVAAAACQRAEAEVPLNELG